jgi:hypothetical protein
LHNSVNTTNHWQLGKVIIEMLHEEILLEIFFFFVYGYDDAWVTLIHVCRRWRSIVFAAPRRLNLRLFCTGWTPAEEMLDIWPALPIVVRVCGNEDEINDNVLAALKEHDRICEVHVDNVSEDDIEELAGAMQVTFPALTHLHVNSCHLTASFPETLLGGSAPNLRSLRLEYVAFPALPKLLLSSPGLVSLSLFYLSHPAYISSDSMVEFLSSLTRLEHLQIKFEYSRPRPDGASRRPPLLTRTVFPVLGTLILKGVPEYLDQLLAHIEAPHLSDVRVKFLDPPNFDISRVSLCIGRTETLEAFDQACMHFSSSNLDVRLSSRKGTTSSKTLILSLQWKDSRWKLAKLALDNCRAPIVFHSRCLPSWTKDIGITPWLEFLRVLTTVENLYLTMELALCIAPALQEPVGEGVLPALRTTFIEIGKASESQAEIIQEVMEDFFAARELSSHPVGRWLSILV